MQKLLTQPDTRVLRNLTLLAAFFALILFIYLAYLNTLMAPYDIVAFEFAFTPARAAHMFEVWGEAGLVAVRASLVADFRFMPAYAFTFAGLILLAARAAEGELQSLGLDVLWLPFAAAALDALENLCLLYVIRAPAAPSFLALVVAGFAASVKFLLLLICLGYLGWVGVVRWRRNRGSTARPSDLAGDGTHPMDGSDADAATQVDTDSDIHDAA